MLPQMFAGRTLLLFCPLCRAPAWLKSIMPIRSRINKAAHLAICLGVVCVVRVGLSTIGYKRIDGLLSRFHRAKRRPVDLRKVAWGVSTAARFVPHASCLTQAVAGRFLLARRGQASTIRIGVDGNSSNSLKAHAWLISGKAVVLGGPGLEATSFVHLVDLTEKR
ncbi:MULTISPECIES: lasso peptide biosynthesis B2 protein [Mesorhizobium]|uniref:Lasso peptide biosynthesis B2 protein n=1 Tax=Mesorhizobium denitrificans TaxID=2294114 RepID=A0A371X959_9HYPH|nr:lasso peptide biosynthesis B2 protein [Mesorhizobium denitrificans]